MKNKSNSSKLRLFLMPILALCMFFVQGVTAKAADMKQIATNKVYTDSLGAGDEEKYYRFTMDTDGYFTINFAKTNPTEDVGSGWDVVLYDMSGNEYSSASSYRVTTNSISEKLDFKKETQLYIKVCCRGHWSEPVGHSYNLEVKSVNDTSWEQEGNNSVNEATVLTNGVSKKGNTWRAEDEDYYVYSVEKQGYFTVDLIRDDTTLDIGSGYDITIYDSNGNNLLEYYRINTNLTTNKLNFMVGDKVYIKIENRGHWSEPVGAVYSIKVNNVEDGTWEKENRAGDSSSLAEMVAANNVLSTNPIRGHIWTEKDRDVYKYSISTYAVLNITFNVNNDSGKLGAGYDVTILDSTGKEIKTFYRITSDQTLQQEIYPGDCYVKVVARSGDVAFNEYTISATHTPAQDPATAIKNTKAKMGKLKVRKNYYKKKVVEVKWSKLEGFEGYKIYRSSKKKKGYKCIGTSTNAYSFLWTDSKVKKNKTYYYKVRAYKTINGRTVYTKYSSIKKIKVK